MKARSINYLICLIMVIMIGIGSRVLHTGFILLDKYLGDALYAVMFYLILSLIWSSGRPLYKACLSMLFMTVIEVFQLTRIPLLLSESVNIVLRITSILLGTKFSWMDLVAYLTGIIIIFAIDYFVLSRVLRA
jgi:hypothetical protein